MNKSNHFYTTFYDRNLKRKFEFLTNLFELRADFIADLYKLRWQIEFLFKQLKQNFPLKYFLGDNENAIKIQSYCALITNLLLRLIQKRVKTLMVIFKPCQFLQNSPV